MDFGSGMNPPGYSSTFTKPARPQSIQGVYVVVLRLGFFPIALAKIPDQADQARKEGFATEAHGTAVQFIMAREG